MATIADWLALLDEQTRKRFAWMQQDAPLLGPRNIPVGPGVVPNPLYAAGDTLGAVGTLRDVAQQEAILPALGAALAATRGSPLQPRSSAFFPTDPGDAEWTREGLRRYLEQSMEGSPVGEFAVGMATDPLSFLGGPGARIGQAAARVPGLGPLGRGLTAADEAYSAAAGGLISGGLGGARELAKRLPGVGRWFEDAPVKQVAGMGAMLGRSVQDPLVRDQLENLVTGSKLGLTGRAADWEQRIRPGWEKIDAAIGELDHPVKQAALLQQRQRALEMENILEARGEQSRIALEEMAVTGEITGKELRRETTALWQQQARAVKALQMGLTDAIEAAKGIPKDALGEAGEAATLSATLTGALRQASDLALGAKDMGTAIKGGTSGMDKVTGLLRMGDPEERILALQAQDPFYRQARERAMAALGDAAAPVFERYKAVAAPEDIDSLVETVRGAFQATEAELAPYTRDVADALGGLAEPKLRAVLNVWNTDNAVSLPRAVRRVLAARSSIHEQAGGVLNDFYREMGGLSAEQRAARVARALSSADRLLDDPGLRHPAAAAVRYEVQKTIERYAGAGDVLRPGDLGDIAANLVTDAYAKSLGITNLPPWFGAVTTALGMWKELALLSPRYHLANVISQLTLSEAEGVPAARVLRLLGRKLPEWARTVRSGELVSDSFDAATSPVYAAVRGADGAFELPAGLTSSVGEALVVPGGTTRATTNVGKVPLALRAGAPGLATGGAYWAGQEDDPERLRNALLVGGAAAAFGAGTPKFVRWNKELTQATETAARGAAFLEGTEAAVGSVASGRGLAARMHAEIPELLKPIDQAAIGKVMTRSDMLPGLDEIRGMRTLGDLLPGPGGQPGAGAVATTAEREAVRRAWLATPEGRVARPEAAAPGSVDLVDPATIVAAPGRFQFKANTDPTTGASSVLRGVTDFDPEKGGVILVWRDPADGRTYVVNGHHRLDLAKRAGADKVLVRYTTAATAEEARVRGALVNIAEGRGTAVDAAKIVRERGYGPDELAAEGISLREGLVRDALALGKLDDRLFQRVAVEPSDTMIRRYAAIGTAVEAPEQQVALADLLDAAEGRGHAVTPGYIDTLARQVRAAGTATTETATLFGLETVTRSLALERAQATEQVRQVLATDAGVFRAASSERFTSRIAEIDPARAGAQATAAQVAAADFERALDNPLATTTQALLDDLARTLAGRAKARRKLTASELGEAVARVKEALSADADALSSKNAWLAATTRREPEDMGGLPLFGMHPEGTRPPATGAGPLPPLAEMPTPRPAAPEPALPPLAAATPPTTTGGPDLPPLAEPTAAPFGENDRLVRVLQIHRDRPGLGARGGTGVDGAAVQAAFAAADGKLNPDALHDLALSAGALPEQATRLRAAWDAMIMAAEDDGIRLANRINFDYSDVTNLVAGLRGSGVAPFATWQSKALPRFATLLIQQPRFIVAWDQLNNLTEQDIAEAGLTARFSRLASMGGLGDWLAERILGRPGTVRGQIAGALFPYADVGREDTLPEGANPLEQGLAALRPLGLGLGPVAALPLMAAGATGELPADIFRTSAYLRGASTALTGREADPELLTKRAIGALRGAAGAPVTPTVTGDFLKDRAIRQRIAEIAVEETGRPPAGAYLLAMDDPESTIWRRATAEVDRQRMGEQLGTQAIVPFRTKYLSATETEVRGRRAAAGVGPADLDRLRGAQPTAAELAAAEMDARRRPLYPGEDLAGRAARLRLRGAEQAAGQRDPGTQALSNLGGTESQTIARQFPEYLAMERRVRHMNPRRRAQLMSAYLAERPILQKYLSERRLY